MNEITGKLANVDWDFTGPNRRERVHDLHSYPAKFIYQIPCELIRLYHPGDRSPVLDPFCGSGTTLVEAAKAGLPSIGVDVHPLAVLIARVKTTPLRDSLIPTAKAVVEGSQLKVADIPPIPRLDHWFQPHVQQTLANLVEQIWAIDDPIVRDCLKVALSRIIIRVSNQESDTRYAAIKKEIAIDQIYKLFLESARFIEEALLEAYGGLFSPNPECKLINQDILQTEPECIGRDIGLVVTSPPYPNAYEYWLYHKYRMYWLKMDPLAVRGAEIGARPHFFRKNPATEADFEIQMRRVFQLLSRVMRQNAYACFLVGRSIIRGKRIDNALLLEQAALSNGFSKIARVERKIPQAQKTFNPAVSTISEESVIIFRLESEN